MPLESLQIIVGKRLSPGLAQAHLVGASLAAAVAGSSTDAQSAGGVLTTGQAAPVFASKN